MSRLPRAVLTIQLLFFFVPAQAADVTIIKPARQRVIFETDYGSLVFRLYPDAAPKHVAQFIRLVEIGAYDSTHFFRVIPGFILQLSDIYDRRNPLTAAQKAANQRLPAEFSAGLKHHTGVLSMAREINDPNSATSSFSILLGKAPHLDGKYTIFGELDSGDAVIRKMLAVPRIDETPTVRLSVNRAYLINDSVAYYRKFPFDPVNSYASIMSAETIEAGTDKNSLDRTRFIVIMMMAIIAVNLAGFFLYQRLSKARLLSLMLVNILICVFSLFIMLTPEGHKKSWLAVLVFVGLFSMFRLLSQFESRRD